MTASSRPLSRKKIIALASCHSFSARTVQVAEHWGAGAHFPHDRARWHALSVGEAEDAGQFGNPREFVEIDTPGAAIGYLPSQALCGGDHNQEKKFL